jgi:hypothetical protein
MNKMVRSSVDEKFPARVQKERLCELRDNPYPTVWQTRESYI